MIDEDGDVCDDEHPGEIYLEEETEVIYEDEAGKTFTIGDNNEITEVNLSEGPEDQLQIGSISETLENTTLQKSTTVEDGAAAREYSSHLFQLI